MTIEPPDALPSTEWSSQPQVTWPDFAHRFGSCRSAECLTGLVRSELETSTADYGLLLRWLDHYAGGSSSDPTDYDALLQQYAPVLQYDSQEPFLAEPADAMPSSAGSPCDPSQDYFGNSLSLSIGGGTPVVASSNGCNGLPTIESTDAWLVPEGQRYPIPSDELDRLGLTEAPEPNSADKVDEAGDRDAIKAQSAAIFAGNAPQSPPNHLAYGRVHEDPDHTVWLDYWLWYYYNDGEAYGFDDHEGDWEHVALRLNQSGTPVEAIYAEHNYQTKCSWDVIEHQDGRPVVYVALGRHASWFYGGLNVNQPTEPDSNDAGGPRLVPSLLNITSDSPSWLQWPGHWGGSGNSPRGPVFQGTAWDDLAQWESDATDDRGHCTPPPAHSEAAARNAESNLKAPGGRTDEQITAPRISARWRDARMLVRYDARASHGARRLVLSVRARDNLVPAVRTLVITHRRTGTRAIPVPGGGGPYVVGASVFTDTGRSPTEEIRVR